MKIDSWIFKVFFYLYVILITLFYIKELPIEVNIIKDYSFNLDHLVIFCILGILTQVLKLYNNDIYIFLGLIFSLFIEFVHLILPYRSFEFIDIAYNVLGYIIGIYFIVIAKKYLWKNY